MSTSSMLYQILVIVAQTQNLIGGCGLLSLLSLLVYITAV